MLARVTVFTLPDGKQSVKHYKLNNELQETYYNMLEAGHRFTQEQLRNGVYSVTVEGPDSDLFIELLASEAEIPGALEKMLGHYE